MTDDVTILKHKRGCLFCEGGGICNRLCWILLWRTNSGGTGAHSICNVFFPSGNLEPWPCMY